MKKIYLDYAATTPVDGKVFKAMSPYFSMHFGNASSLHAFGREAKKALETSRKILAKSINASPSEVFFTSSATESNNMVLQGIVTAAYSTNKHIIISSIEHASIAKTAQWLKQKGCNVTQVPVDEQGNINIQTLKDAITKDTILVSVLHASNEIGTIQPILEIGQICREHNIYFHTDAVQSFGKIDIDVKKMNIDLLTASSHKIYGPKGVALLYIRKGVKIDPLLHGGGQEQGTRSSTVNVAGVVGFAKAVEISEKIKIKENKRLEKLRDSILDAVLKIPGAHLNGSIKNRLSNNLSFWFENVDGEALIAYLDLAGFACSTGASCAASDFTPSHVLLSLGLSVGQAQNSLRISLGRQTTSQEVKKFIAILSKTIEKLRKIG